MVSCLTTLFGLFDFQMEITIISFAIELATFSTTCEIILEYIKICGYDGALKN